MHKQILSPTEEGTPQGGIISPVLANLALDGLESRLREHFPKPRTQSQPERVYFLRYADDFIVTGNSRELLQTKVKPLVAAFLGERGLELSEEKTQITPIEDGFDFLGQTVRKYQGKLLITPSQTNVKTFLEKVRAVIKANKQATAGGLIVQLNPLIRGWANYHRHVSSKATFACVDHAIFEALWRWAKRRHPNKGAHWIRNRYFCQQGSRAWSFFGEVKGAEGATPLSVAAASLQNTDPAAHQNQGERQSLRSRLGTLFRGTPRSEDAPDAAGPTQTLLPLERTEGSLSDVRSENHQANGVAQPPHCLAGSWRGGQDGKSCAVASQLPPTASQPTSLGSETASFTGR